MRHRGERKSYELSLLKYTTSQTARESTGSSKNATVAIRTPCQTTSDGSRLSESGGRLPYMLGRETDRERSEYSVDEVYFWLVQLLLRHFCLCALAGILVSPSSRSFYKQLSPSVRHPTAVNLPGCLE